MTFGLTENR
jgi:hypothetical protein